MKGAVFFIAVIFFRLFSLSAAEYSDGSVRLVLDEKTGSFSLYSIDGGGKPLALFEDEDPRTSFLSVIVNDRPYKLGGTVSFKTRLDTSAGGPSLVYEAPFMTVTQNFTFVKTRNSLAANGVRITVTLENRGDREVPAGARFLLDTSLGEKSALSPFFINGVPAGTEILAVASGENSFWTDRNGGLSLSGSLDSGSSGGPDSVHFANWKKMSEVTWKAVFQAGRNFNHPPYSIRDTAVCYYFDPRPLESGGKRSFGFTLALGDEIAVDTAPAPEEAPPALSSAVSAAREQALAEIRALIAKIDALISSGASEEEIETLEVRLNELNEKYNSPGFPR